MNKILNLKNLRYLKLNQPICTLSPKISFNKCSFNSNKKLDNRHYSSFVNSNNKDVYLKNSYTKGIAEPELLTCSIGEAFDNTVNKYSNGDALVVPFQNVRYSWKELQERVDNIAKSLIVLGIQHGDRIGLMSPNRNEWLISQLALSKLGAILVNINPAYKTSELEYCINQSGCKWIICPERYKSSDFLGMLNQILDLSTNLPGEIRSEKVPELKGIIGLPNFNEEDYKNNYKSVLPWEILEKMKNSNINDQELSDRVSLIQFDEPVNIQYTSGTTGKPKGATLSHYNMLNNGYMVGNGLGLSNNDKVVIPVPLHHCFGIVMSNNACITHGSTMIYPCPTFDAEETLKAVHNEKATVLNGVPTMFIAQLNHPNRSKYNLSTLRTGIMAGSICPIEVMRRVISEMNMKEVQICYGMTETSPVSIQSASNDPIEKRVSTVGRTGPHLESKIVDNAGRIVPIGKVGELCTRGYSVMLGYWKNKEATNDAIDPAKWMKTGDLATMDHQGYITIVGRNKDLIIRGGENIYPREIEDFFYTHKSILDVQVIGIPDEKYGEEVVAWVKLQDGHNHITEVELKEYCKDKIANYKIPKHFIFVTEFPMTSSGKIQKYLMKEITTKEFKNNNNLKK